MRHRAILERIRRTAKAGMLGFSKHAFEGMNDERETPQSIAALLREARVVCPQENGRWRVLADGLVVILEISETMVRVQTVYAG